MSNNITLTVGSVVSSTDFNNEVAGDVLVPFAARFGYPVPENWGILSNAQRLTWWSNLSESDKKNLLDTCLVGITRSVRGVSRNWYVHTAQRSGGVAAGSEFDVNVGDFGGD